MSTITAQMSARSLDVRKARARLLGEMRALPTPESRAMAADLLDTRPAALEALNVERFLAKIHEPPGRTLAFRVARWLEHIDASPYRRLGELSHRQTVALAERLRDVH